LPSVWNPATPPRPTNQANSALHDRRRQRTSKQRPAGRVSATAAAHRPQHWRDAFRTLPHRACGQKLPAVVVIPERPRWGSASISCSVLNFSAMSPVVVESALTREKLLHCRSARG
jgi:hypothetical protein